MKSHLQKNESAVDARAKGDLGYIILLLFHFYWGEITTTKWREWALPTKFAGFSHWILSRNGSACQAIIYTVMCSLRVQLCCRACLHEAHSAKRIRQWALQLIRHVYTNKAFLRGNFHTFRGGNDCTSNGSIQTHYQQARTINSALIMLCPVTMDWTTRRS